MARGAFTFACRMDSAGVMRAQITGFPVSPLRALAQRWNAIMMAILGFFVQICVRPLKLVAVPVNGPWRAKARANPLRAFTRFFTTNVFPVV